MNHIAVPNKRGFSLVEVVVAVGIFAIAIVGVIGLLSPTNKAIADVADNDSATKVVSAIQQNLQQRALTGLFVTSGTSAGVGSSALATENGLLHASAPVDPADGSPSVNTKIIYANRDGSKVGLGTDVVWAGSNTEKYFEAVLLRNSLLSPNSTAANADAVSGYLAYTIRIRWPAFTPDGNEFTAHSQKSVLIVPGAITR
jgi:prepilin-type N-terminal cleavage/methylation domain-containing protein